MPSHLRYQSISSPLAAGATESRHPAALQPPQKKQRMTITQTYFLAHTARGKLSSEAARGDHDLRLLVGHANLLDALTVELQDAEREQDAWFNETVKQSRNEDEPRRVQWKDAVAQAQEMETAEEDSYVDSDEEDFYQVSAPLQMKVAPRRPRSPPLAPTMEEDEDEDMEDDLYTDDDEHNAELSLVRTASHSANPPELVNDSSDESDDEMSSPLSPPLPTQQIALPTPHGILTKDFADLAKPAVASQEYYLENHAPMVAAY